MTTPTPDALAWWSNLMGPLLKARDRCRLLYKFVPKEWQFPADGGKPVTRSEARFIRRISPGLAANSKRRTCLSCGKKRVCHYPGNYVRVSGELFDTWICRPCAGRWVKAMSLDNLLSSGTVVREEPAKGLSNEDFVASYKLMAGLELKMESNENGN